MKHWRIFIILIAFLITYLFSGFLGLLMFGFIYLTYILFAFWVNLWDLELTAEGTKKWVEKHLEKDQ